MAIMTKHKASEARRSLRQLLPQLEALLEILLRHQPMLRVYLDSKPRTCGNQGCHCARGKKHPAWVVRIPAGRQCRSRSVTPKVYRQLEPLAAEYRRFRQALAQWRRLVREAEQHLRKLEASRLLDPEVEVEKRDGKSKGRHPRR